MKLHSGKIYRLRNGTIFGPLEPWGNGILLSNSLTMHTWHPDTGCEASGYDPLDIIAEVYPTPAILQFNSDND